MLLRPRHACRWAGARRAFSASVSDPYKVLGVERTVTREKVQQAYLQKAMEWHPDRKQNNPQATERMKELNRAKELVLDSIKNGGKPMAEETRAAEAEEQRKAERAAREAVAEAEARARAAEAAKAEAEAEAGKPQGSRGGQGQGQAKKRAEAAKARAKARQRKEAELAEKNAKRQRQKQAAEQRAKVQERKEAALAAQRGEKQAQQDREAGQIASASDEALEAVASKRPWLARRAHVHIARQMREEALSYPPLSEGRTFWFNAIESLEYGSDSSLISARVDMAAWYGVAFTTHHARFAFGFAKALLRDPLGTAAYLLRPGGMLSRQFEPAEKKGR
eukprot:Transcript_20624.p1 GENE.Transcript_20624~~Transcript_20624.p1  ORF type:complete len:336 (-),score=39.87 Transcript_20624:17-1024(-)